MSTMRSNNGNGWSAVHVGVGLGSAAAIAGLGAAISKGRPGAVINGLGNVWRNSKAVSGKGMARIARRAGEAGDKAGYAGYMRSMGNYGTRSENLAAKASWSAPFNKANKYLSGASAWMGRNKGLTAAARWGAYGVGGAAALGAGKRAYDWGRWG